MTQQRTVLLRELISLDRTLSEVMQSLHPFGWDSAEDLVELRRADIVNTLRKYLSRGLSATEVEEWANALEGREDVGYEAEYDTLLRSVINELANPSMTRFLDTRTAKEWIERLET